MDSNIQKQKNAVAWLSVISNTTLVCSKLAIGMIIGSVSVISEAIHSGMDLLASVIALFAVKTSGKAPDEKHPFGHGKLENISGTLEALLIFAAAIWIVYEAIERLMHPRLIETVGWGVVIMAISTIVNIAVSHVLFTVGKKTDSIALMADGWHLRTDVYTCAGVMLGLAIIWFVEKIAPGWNIEWVDSVAALGVALLIAHAAWKLTREAGRDLLDSCLPTEETVWIRNNLIQYRPTVKGFHKLRTRKAGGVRYVEFHLIVDQNMSVKDSHKITERLAVEIRVQFPGTNVIIHVEPCDGFCKPSCLSGCLCPDDNCKAIVEERVGIRKTTDPSSALKPK